MKLRVTIIPILILVGMLGSRIGYAEPISQKVDRMDNLKVTTDYMAIKAVYGESLHDYKSMYAVACALRNRHTLHGVYGVLQTPSGTMYQKAARAWFEAKNGPDVTFGATNWLSDYDIKHCDAELTAFRCWMKETAYIGHTHFYKEL